MRTIQEINDDLTDEERADKANDLNDIAEEEEAEEWVSRYYDRD